MIRLFSGIRVQQVREISLVLILAITIILFGTQINNYYNARTFNRISTSVAIITVLAVGQTLVVLTRNIDLSVGSIVGFTAYFAGQQLSQNQEMSPLLVVGIAMGFGAVLGGINGVIVTFARVPAIIVTLGTLAIYRGLLVDYAQARTITDIGCSYKLFRKDVLRHIEPCFRTTNPLFATEIILVLIRLGVPFIEIPVTYRARVGSSTIITHWHKWVTWGLRVLAFIVMFRFRPLPATVAPQDSEGAPA